MRTHTTRTLRAALLGSLTLAGLACVDLDERLVSTVTTSFYGTPDGLNAAVNATYQQLRNYWGREQSMSIAQMGTDTWTTGDQPGYKYMDYYDAGLNASVGEFRFPWQAWYQQINTANAVLERGPGTPNIDPTIRNIRLAEVRFLRALAYFMLVQTYGGVHVTLSENQGVQTAAARQSPDSIYKIVIADLDSAIKVLPVTQADFGRVTRGAAQFLLAKVYLTRAYKKDIAAPYGGWGEGQADFQKALDLAETLIASNTYTLVNNYHDLWCVARAEDVSRRGYCQVNGLNERNTEVIFPVQFSSVTAQFSTDNNNYLHLVYLAQYEGNNVVNVGMTRDLNNGRPFRRVRPTQLQQSLYQRWVGAPGGEILDTRYDGSFQTLWIANVASSTNRNPTSPCPRCTSGTVVTAGDTSMFMPGFPVDSNYRKAREYVVLTPCTAAPENMSACPLEARSTLYQTDWVAYPALKKFQDNTRTNFNDQDGGKDIYLFRHAETYLIAAEAALGLANQAKAIQYLNVVRERAAVGATNKALMRAATPAVITLDYIMEERERELAGELNRWYDLTRPGPQYYVNRVKKYNPYAVANIQIRHALRPIPQTQIDLTTTPFAQNPGY